jgi:hypothetical protein
MNIARCHHAICYSEGCVYVFGGGAIGVEAEFYNQAVWTVLPQLPFPVIQGNCDAFNG